MSNKFILVINGPMCSGKSTLTKVFLERDETFRGSYDAVKWLIGNYSADNENHRTMAKKITFDMIASACKNGLSIIIDGGFGDFRESYKELAHIHNMTYLSVNIEAPFEVLKQRFLERVEKATTQGTNISVTTLEGFQSRYDWYFRKNKDNEAIVYNSDELTTKEIYTEIKKRIKIQS